MFASVCSSWPGLHRVFLSLFLSLSLAMYSTSTLTEFVVSMLRCPFPVSRIYFLTGILFCVPYVSRGPVSTSSFACLCDGMHFALLSPISHPSARHRQPPFFLFLLCYFLFSLHFLPTTAHFSPSSPSFVLLPAAE